jgi:hypothetical protein
MSSILNVALGVAIVFAVFALVVSGLQEAIASLFNRRGRTLVKALEMLLGDEAGNLLTGTSLLEPLTNATNRVKATRKRAPSYLPSWLFAATVLPDEVLDALPTAGATDPAAPADATETKVAEALAALPGATAVGAKPLAGVIAALAKEVGKDRAALESALANWFDLYMERISGWYTRHTRWILFVIALFVAFGANVDAVGITRNAIDNPGTQTTLVSAASSIGPCPTGGSTVADSSSLGCASQDLSSLPIGQLDLFWTAPCPIPSGQTTAPTHCAFWARHGMGDGGWSWAMFYKIVGLLLGAFAISLGAPFWFDLIGRGLALRGTGPPPPPASTAASVPRGTAPVTATAPPPSPPPPTTATAATSGAGNTEEATESPPPPGPSTT